MDEVKLTVGVVVAGNHPGARRTMRLLGRDPDQLVVVDDRPDDPGADVTRYLCSTYGGKYVPVRGERGLYVGRNAVFAAADHPYVAVVDADVAVHPGALKALRAQYNAAPEAGDLYCGPMLTDGLWIYGINSGWTISGWGVMAAPPPDVDGKDRWEVAWHRLGFFSCRRDAWLGFHPQFRDGDCGEFYLPTKYRKAGRKVYALAGAGWSPLTDGPATPPPKDVQVRDYLAACGELKVPPGVVYAQMAAGGWIDAAGWTAATGSPPPEVPKRAGEPSGRVTPDTTNPPRPAKTCGGCTKLSNVTAAGLVGDMAKRTDPHAVDLRRLGAWAARYKSCGAVGQNNHNVIATLVAAKCRTVIVYGVVAGPKMERVAARLGEGVEFFRYEPVEGGRPKAIPAVELLYVDLPPYAADDLWPVLEQAKDKVEAIVVRGTGAHADTSADDRVGLIPAVRRLAEGGLGWSLAEQSEGGLGVTVLTKDPPPSVRRPGFLARAASYAAAKVRLWGSGKGYVTPAVAAKRYAVCTSNGGRCPLSLRDPATDSCAKCGCNLTNGPGGSRGKVYYPDEECPMGLWKAVAE